MADNAEFPNSPWHHPPHLKQRPGSQLRQAPWVQPAPQVLLPWVRNVAPPPQQLAHWSGGASWGLQPAWFCASCGTPHHNRKSKACRICGAERPPSISQKQLENHLSKGTEKDKKEERGKESEEAARSMPKMPPQLSRFAQSLRPQDPAAEAAVAMEEDGPELSKQQLAEMTKALNALKGVPGMQQECKSLQDKIDRASPLRPELDAKALNLAYQQAVKRRGICGKRVQDLQKTLEEMREQQRVLEREMAAAEASLREAEDLVTAAHRAVQPPQEAAAAEAAKAARAQDPILDKDKLEALYTVATDEAKKLGQAPPDKYQFVWNMACTEFAKPPTDPGRAMASNQRDDASAAELPVEKKSGEDRARSRSRGRDL